MPVAMPDQPPPDDRARIAADQAQALKLAQELVPLITAHMKAAQADQRFEFLVAIFGKDDGEAPQAMVCLSRAPVATLIMVSDLLRSSFAGQFQAHARAHPGAAKA